MTKVLSVALLAGASSVVSPAVAQAPTANGGAPQGSSITFSNLIHRPGKGSFVGVVKEDIRLLLIETLRNEGFEARGAESLVFARDESAKADFVIGGTVEEAVCDSEGKAADCCRLGVRWELLDTRRDEVVYRQFGRHAECHLRQLGSGEAYRRLAIGALRKVLQRKAFQERLQAGSTAATDPIYAPASFARCKRGDARVDKHSDRTLEATVTVRSGKGHGSGFIVASEGLVLTAAHVLAGAEVQVQTRDGVSYRAHPIRVSHKFDAALLRVDLPTPWPAKKCLPLETGANPGQPVYAVGAPAFEDLSFSITRGIVSGLREIEGVRLIQTDAPISPGNSGGPLVDSQGRALAVVVSKVASRAVEGIAFGTPIQVVLGALGIGAGDKCDQGLLDAKPVKALAAAAKVLVDDEDPVPKWNRSHGQHLHAGQAGGRLSWNLDKKTKAKLVTAKLSLGGFELLLLTSPKHPTAAHVASVRLRESVGRPVGCESFDIVINNRAYDPLKRSVQRKKSGSLGKQQRVVMLESRIPMSAFARLREHAPSLVVRTCNHEWSMAPSQLNILREWLDGYDKLVGK